MGLFENAQVDDAAASDIMFSTQHQQTALELARQGIVLLKNDRLLPLRKGQKIFITGPNANNHTILGDWVFKQPEENITTVVEGLKIVAKPSTSIDFFDVGSQVKTLDPTLFVEAAERAKVADVAIVVVGSNALRYDRKGKTAGENVARSSINLFGQQLNLVQATSDWYADRRSVD